MITYKDPNTGKVYNAPSLNQAMALAANDNGGPVVINESFAKPMENIKPLESSNRLSEDDVFDWTKEQQVAWLKEKDIKPARTQRGRVQQIVGEE